MLSTGQTIAGYQIVEKLVGGGMGVVFRAEDLKLDREVALKFLPPELSKDDTANERFIVEAKAASALNDPNVCPVYDIKETDDGALFIVMPWYDGQTLKYRLKDGAFSEDQAFDVARQIASGLSAAHNRGIIHRDIKPANVMLTDDGRAIILDFGLAKLASGLDLTKSGSTVGTAFYMSPEQLRGGEVDRRTDLWSLGVVLYQLLAGRRPFDGEYEQAVAYAIVNQDPAPIDGLSPEHRTILGRLLSKDPADRFQSASELIEAIDRSGSQRQTQSGPIAPPSRDRFILGKSTMIGIAVILALVAVIAIVAPWRGTESTLESGLTSGRHTIAVLPFANLRSDPETDYLGYAMADQVIGSLSYVRNLNVRPASSVRKYQNQSFDARDAGRELAADFVVAGNYLQQDDRMRMTVEMVDVDSDEIIWTEPIEVRSDDVFEMQDIVTKSVLDRLQVSFSADERSRMQTDVSANPLAYEYYLRAISHPRTVEGNELALDLLEQSIALDSTYAPAWSELGFRRHALGMFSLAGGDVSRSAEAAFDRALKLNPNLISALVDISTYYTDNGRTDEAYDLALRAVELNPNNALGHFAKGYALRYAGMMQESEVEMRAALALDTTNTRFRSAGITLMMNGHYDDARRAFAIDAPSPYYHAFMGESYVREGRIEEAIPHFEEAERLDPDGIEGPKSAAYLGSIRNDRESGLRAVHKMEAADVIDAEVDFYIAAYYCLNGDSAGCLRNLELAVTNGYFNYPEISTNPFFNLVRGTPEFEAILDEARRKHEQFKERHSSN